MKASRLFATEEMKQAARDFRLSAQAIEYIHPINEEEVDEDMLLEDYFLAGAIWYREKLKEGLKSLLDS